MERVAPAEAAGGGTTGDAAGDDEKKKQRSVCPPVTNPGSSTQSYILGSLRDAVAQMAVVRGHEFGVIPALLRSQLLSGLFRGLLRALVCALVSFFSVIHISSAASPSGGAA